MVWKLNCIMFKWERWIVLKVDALLNLYQTDTEHILYNSKEAFVLSPSECQFSPRKLRHWGIRNRYPISVLFSVPSFSFFIFLLQRVDTRSHLAVASILQESKVSSSPLYPFRCSSYHLSSDFPDLLPRGYKRTPELCMGDGKNSTVSRCC